VVQPAGTTFYLTDVGVGGGGSEGGPGAATSSSRCDPATSQVTVTNLPFVPNLPFGFLLFSPCCHHPHRAPDTHYFLSFSPYALSPYALSPSLSPPQGPCVFYVAVTSAAPLTPPLVNRPPAFEIAARTPGT